ncbi:MAG: DUF2283 domain-containing protein [Chloroflexi bacterium]|nr:DUF2283 domain-containing protein [Chloroflexota bacterium]MBV9596260.1 DUF2283 domain-containing protein [Chloroflexota bacterium]
MKVIYDPEGDTLYVQLGDEQPVHGAPARLETPELGDGAAGDDDNTILHYDAAGRIAAIELLSASRRLPPHELRRVTVEIAAPGSAPAVVG